MKKTQMTLAMASGIRQEHWSRMETGRLPVNVKALSVMAKLGADVHYILTGDRRLGSGAVLTDEELGLLKLFHSVRDAGGLATIADDDGGKLNSPP
ncbi:hypothetical protein [Vreelandella olivaria]|uniref:hypothetical protein n=1 Tax=Vreelandella olivaria TaxID=390919 RepID=UPI00201F6222|nr:hypothetical protein [Halomonas olivaria]